MIKPDVQDPRNLFRTQRRFSVGNTRPRNVTVLGCRSAASAQRLIGRSRYSHGVTCDFKSLPSYAKSAPGVPNGKAGLAARAKVSYAGVNGFLRPLSDPECNRRFWALSIGQLFCSVATLVHDSYIPLYLSQELGLNNTKIGVLHAVSQLLAQVSKGVAGVVGDILGSQIKVVVFGTLVTSLCKPLFALSAGMKGAMGPAAALWLVGVGKMLDRSSKGIRDAPSKTLVQQLSRESGDSSEAAFGMRQSLSCAGSLLGSVVAAATFALCGRSYTLTFGVALIPPVLALLWLIVTFREQLMEPASASGRSGGGGGGSSRKGGMIEANPVSFLYCMRALMSQLQPAYWQSLAVLATLYLARFDFSFVMLRAKQVVPAEALPMMVAACMVTQSMCASVFGQLARQSGVYGRNRILLTGFGVLVVANAVMSLPQMASPAGMALGSLLIGLHMGMSHALLISMCSTYMPHWGVPGIPSLAGTAMSFTDIVLGVVLACANLLAGRLSDLTVSAGLGSVGCFAAGAVAATLAGVLLLLFERFGALGKQELVPSWPSRGRPPTRTVRPRHA